MHPQLQAVEREYQAATDRLHRLRDQLAPEEWSRRTDPARWSAAECVAHLNLTSLAYRGILTDAIARARRVGGPPPARLRRDPVGWLLWKTMSPPVRGRTRTIPAFMPEGQSPVPDLIRDFEDRQEEQLGLLHAADGLPIQKVRIASPFHARVQYNLYACFTILPAHQHRHLWQAEQGWPGRFR